MKLLITGGAGYVGVSLIEALMRKGIADQICVYDNLSRGSYGLFFQNFGSKVKFLEAELLDSRTLAKALQDMDGVFHLAAKVSSPHSNLDSHFFEQVNHWGTAELVNLVENSQVKFFLYLSSATVYGASGQLFDEQSALMPTSFYGHSKMRGETHTWRLFEKLPSAYVVRSGNVYGFNACTRIDAVINRYLFEAQYQNKVIANGSGNQVRSFVQVDKLAAFLVNFITGSLPNGIYNCAQYNFSINDLVDQIKQIYPELETQHLNQHLDLPSTALKLPIAIDVEQIWPQRSFLEELEEMKNRFGF
jgi:UDP-glucose 4-epimerase